MSVPALLRPVEPEDIEAIAFLELALFPDEAWDVFMLAEEIGHRDRRYIAAVDPESEEIIGYAGIMLAGDTADLHTIGTTRPGQGIGQAMLANLEETALSEGAERMLLEVREDNERARAFYRAAGFEELGVRRGYYRTAAGAVDAIVMAADLPRTA